MSSYEKRQATLARFLTGQTLGLMTGAALGGAIGDWLGWRSVFWVLAAIYVTGRRRPVRRHARPSRRSPGRTERTQGSMIGQMLARPAAAAGCSPSSSVVALEGGVFWGAFTFVGADLHQRFDMGFAAIGLAVAAFGAGGFALCAWWRTMLVRLLGERGLCTWGGLGLGIAFAAMALAPTRRGRVRRHRRCRACRSTCCTTRCRPTARRWRRKRAVPAWRCSRSACSSARRSACPSPRRSSTAGVHRPSSGQRLSPALGLWFAAGRCWRGLSGRISGGPGGPRGRSPALRRHPELIGLLEQPWHSSAVSVILGRPVPPR